MTHMNVNLRSIVIWLISLGLCLSASGTIVNHWQRKEIVRERERDLARLKEENRSLKLALEESKQESYVERIARDKLGLVKDGEIVVIMPENRRAMGDGRTVDTGPNWRKWLNLFY